MYQVVFTGRLRPGAERAQVEAQLIRLFKATPQQVRWFLRGVPIVVKSSDDPAVVGRYHQALSEAGLICEMRKPEPLRTRSRSSSASVAASRPQQESLPGMQPEPAPPAAAAGGRTQEEPPLQLLPQGLPPVATQKPVSRDWLSPPPAQPLTAAEAAPAAGRAAARAGPGRTAPAPAFGAGAHRRSRRCGGRQAGAGGSRRSRHRRAAA